MISSCADSLLKPTIMNMISRDEIVTKFDYLIEIIVKSFIKSGFINFNEKDEMVQMLIMFEEDPENIEIVERRRRMWSYVNELKEDKYFSKYIIFST